VHETPPVDLGIL